MLFQNKPKQRLVDVTPILQEFWKVADMCEGKNPYENIRIKAYRRCFERVAEAPVVDATPCDFCAYNPPSSLDGKPCTMCPACKRRNGGYDDTERKAD